MWQLSAHKFNLCMCHNKQGEGQQEGGGNVGTTNQTLVIRRNVVINTVTMSLPALPDGIPVFLFPLLVSELFCPPTPACLLALLTGHRQRVNEAMSLSLSLSRFGLVSASFSLSMACQLTCLW